MTTTDPAGPGPAPGRVEVPRFPGGRRVALTTSFDDGHVFDRRIVAAFNAWGLKATFNLNSSRLRRTTAPDPDRFEHLSAGEVAGLFAGHEVAAHTVSHPSLVHLAPAQVVEEVMADRAALEDLVGRPVRGFAYPYGHHDGRVRGILRGLGLAYARTCADAADCFPPEDAMAWGATAHQFAFAGDGPGRFAAWCEDPYFHGAVHLWGHGYEFEERGDWGALERIYRPLAGRPGVWYCTNLELFDYEAARRQLVVAANRRSAFNPGGLAVTVRVDGRLLDVPAGATVRLDP